MSHAFEEALKAVANIPKQPPAYNLGQPVWIHGDAVTWIVIGIFKAMWSEWFVAAVPENELDAQPCNIPFSWLTDLAPGEKRLSNVVQFSHYRRIKHETF